MTGSGKGNTVTDLTSVAPAFVEMAHRIVWCVAATTGQDGRPATRVLHPIWQWDDGALQGWILTSPRSPKADDLRAIPALSLTYWAPNHDTCTADCATSWDDTPEGRREGWDRFLHAAAPVGYDPAIIPQWTSPEAPEFGVLRLHADALRVMPGSLMTEGAGELLSWRRA